MYNTQIIQKIFTLLIILHLSFKLAAQCNTNDYLALRALYISTNGDNWTKNEGWNISSARPYENCNLGSFHGVYLNDNGRVELISLGQNNLFGQLPIEISLLDELKTLWLNQNQ